jgi:hypothetical protein
MTKPRRPTVDGNKNFNFGITRVYVRAKDLMDEVKVLNSGDSLKQLEKEITET